MKRITILKAATLLILGGCQQKQELQSKHNKHNNGSKATRMSI